MWNRNVTLHMRVGFNAADLENPRLNYPMGDLRKLELARTLATGAKVLLLDEVLPALPLEKLRKLVR